MPPKVEGEINIKVNEAVAALKKAQAEAMASVKAMEYLGAATGEAGEAMYAQATAAKRLDAAQQALAANDLPEAQNALAQEVLKARAAVEKAENSVEKLGEASEDANNKTSAFGDRFEDLTGVSLTTAGAITALTGVITYSIGEAMAAEQAMAQTEAAIAATGAAAGLSADDVANFASALETATGLGAETIQAGENMLLTFKNIGGETFPRATAAMADMAVAMAGGNLAAVDLKGTAIQLGKALNDPAEGVSALSRVGVTFTESQKKMIEQMVKVGNVAGAQAVVLAELESEFGGAAQAAGETTAGSFAKLQNSTGNLAEALGTKLLPALTETVDGLTEVANSLNGVSEFSTGAILSTENLAKTLEMYGLKSWANENILSLENVDKTLEMYGVNVLGVTEKQQAIAQASQDAAAAADANAAATARMTGMANAYTDAAKLALIASEDVDTELMRLKDIAPEAFNGIAAAQQSALSATDLLAAGMQKYTDTLLFNKAAAGLDAESALSLGIAMGVVDTKSLLAAQAVATLTANFDEDGNGAVDAGENIKGYKDAILALQQGIAALPDQKTIRIDIETNGVVPDMPGTAGTSKKPIALAGGADFVVPPGFPNDSFPMRVQSGERVVVQTPEQQRAAQASGGGVTYNITVDARGAVDAAAVEAAGYRGAQRALAEAGRAADTRRRV